MIIKLKDGLATSKNETEALPANNRNVHAVCLIKREL